MPDLIRHPPSPSPVVELRPHRGEAVAGDTVGGAALAADQLAALEALEDAHPAIRQQPPVPGEAIHLHDLARRLIAPVDDLSTLRQRVKHALFVFRYVHWNSPCQAPRGGVKTAWRSAGG